MQNFKHNSVEISDGFPMNFGLIRNNNKNQIYIKF